MKMSTMGMIMFTARSTGNPYLSHELGLCDPSILFCSISKETWEEKLEREREGANSNIAEKKNIDSSAD